MITYAITERSPDIKDFGSANELSLCTSGVSQLRLFADLRSKFVVVLELVPELLFEHAVEVAVVAAEGQELHRKLLGVVVRLLLVEDDVEPAHLLCFVQQSKVSEVK